MIVCERSVDTIIFVSIDPFTGWWDRSPWQESDGGPSSFPRAHGGVFQTAEEESAEGVRSERAGKNRGDGEGELTKSMERLFTVLCNPRYIFF